MTPTTSRNSIDARRDDAATVLVNYWYTASHDDALDDLHNVVEQWSTAPWPQELLSFSSYLSIDGHTALTFVQSTGSDSYRPFVRSLRVPARAEAVEYRPHRSILLADPPPEPGCVVVATFDVDGPERQAYIIDAVINAIEQAPPAANRGMISANFFVSTDGTRVLNFAEWTSDEAHEAFLDGVARAAALRISQSIPGVRPIGHRRLHVHRVLEPAASRPAADPARGAVDRERRRRRLRVVGSQEDRRRRSDVAPCGGLGPGVPAMRRRRIAGEVLP